MRRLGVTAGQDRSRTASISAKALKPTGTGLVWTAVEEGRADRTHRSGATDDEPVVRAQPDPGHQPRHQRQGQPAEHADLRDAARQRRRRSPARSVSIVRRDGQTALDRARPAPTASRSRPQTRAARSARLVRSSRSSSPPRRTATSPTSAATGTKASCRGTSASPFDLDEAEPLLRGTVFTDRGVYKLGEEVHFKAVLRSNTPDGIRLLADGTADLSSRVRDSRDKVVDERTVKVNAWSSGRVDVDAAGRRRARQLLGPARCSRPTGRSRRRPSAKSAAARTTSPARSTTTCRRTRSVNGSFLVAAYRRPDFRVDVTLDRRTPTRSPATR